MRFHHGASSINGASEASSMYGASDSGTSAGPAELGPALARARARSLEDVHLACRFGRIEAVKYFAESNPENIAFFEPDNNGKTALEYAVETARDTKLLHELLKSKTNAKAC